MRFEFHPHDSSELTGYAHPILDLHGNPLVYARLVPPTHPECVMTFEPGVPFEVNEQDHMHGGFHLAQFCRQHPDFQTVSRSGHPAPHTTPHGFAKSVTEQRPTRTKGAT
jgi:hypothetical protein